MLSSKKSTLTLAVNLIFANIAFAGVMGSPPSRYSPVVSIFAGPAGMDFHHAQTFVGTDDEVFSYHSQENNQTQGFVGIFLGLEHPLPWYSLFLQLGAEYTYWSNVTVSGTNLVGIEPRTSTVYDYRFKIQTQQALVVAKLLAPAQLLTGTHPHLFYPYVSAGLGAAFNQASHYGVSTTETNGVNITPTFASNLRTGFSYNLGLGVESNISDHFRAGIGYRFTDFRNASLGYGQITLPDASTFPVPFSLGIPHVYANQFVVQLSYVA